MNAKRLLKSIALAVAILMGVCLIGAGAGFVLRYIEAWNSKPTPTTRVPIQRCALSACLKMSKQRCLGNKARITMKKTVEMLREIQYQRLSTTPEVRAMQRLANLPGIDISSSVDFANGLLSAEINAGIVYVLRQIAAMGRADTEDLHRLRTLTPERFYWLKDNFPSLMSEIEALGLMPHIREIAYGRYAAEPTEGQRPSSANDVSEAVASGEIKSTGKSVSVDEVIADIDEHLKGESNL